MKFFSRFTWAVPLAFADAISQCLFEEGDVIYDTLGAYEGEWDTAKRSFKNSFQVRFPARVTGTPVDRGEGVFYANWDSEVRLELLQKNKPVGVGQVVTTQGRLFTMLWRGESSVLDMSTDNPEAPLLVTTVTRKLPEVSDGAAKVADSYPAFVMPRDLSNPVSRDKFNAVRDALKERLVDEPLVLTPEQLSIPNWERTSPTIEIVFFRVQGMERGELFERVKKVVYKPNRKSEKSNFRMAAHGIIV